MYGSSQVMLGVPPPVLLQPAQMGIPLSLVPPPSPVRKPDLAALGTFVRSEPTQGFPAKFRDTRLNKDIWTNSAPLFAHKPRYTFVSWETHLATPAQNDAWTRLMVGSGSQGSAPTPIVGDPSVTIVKTAIVDDSVNLRTPLVGDPIRTVVSAPSQLAPVALPPTIAQEMSQLTMQPSGAVTSATAVYTPSMADADMMSAQTFFKKWGFPLSIGIGALVLLSLIRR